ncbi:MAG: hypothetical protein FWG98_09635 [Candidatus Cloacimonetes bacterium]|nr:hypothetical protein [Candidatus Cloacimonadota bacterium]
MKFRRELFFFFTLLIVMLSITCTNSTDPSVEPNILCHMDYDIIHGTIMIDLVRDLDEYQYEKFISDYSKYGLRVLETLSSNQYPRYYTFDHTKIHCLLFHLLILDDERVNIFGAELLWQSHPTVWTPGYITIGFRDNVTDELIKDFIADNAEYELKLHNVLVPKLKWYLFSYNHHKLTNYLDLNGRDKIWTMQIDNLDYYKLIKPIENEENHVCHGDYDIVHGAIHIYIPSDMDEEQIENFLSDYSEYGLRVAKTISNTYYPLYWVFDHTKIHCLLFELLILNDERVTPSGTGLLWQTLPTSWTPGYIRIYFDEYVCNEKIEKFIPELTLEYAEYDLKLYNILVPRLNWYLFSYDYLKLTNFQDLNRHEYILEIVEDEFDYFKLIDLIEK